MKPFRWSYSVLKDFERCPRLYHWRRVQRLPEAPSAALERGNLLHKLVEDYLTGKAPLDPMFTRFAEYIEEVKAAKGLEVEQLWAFGRGWEPVSRDAAWLWVKMDAYHPLGRTRARVVDWKSGGIYAENAEQVRLYAVAAMSRDPRIKEVDVDLCYFDQRQVNSETVKRRELDINIRDFNQRAAAVEAERKFKPTPGRHCQWCTFSKAKGGECEAGT